MGKFSEMTYEERMVEAQRLHDAGDPRPASQIEQETMAQEAAGQPVTDPAGRDDSQLGAAASVEHETAKDSTSKQKTDGK